MSKEANTQRRKDAITTASDEVMRAEAVLEAAKEALKSAQTHWREACQADYGPTLFEQE